MNISKKAIREASVWLVTLESGEATDDDQQRWQQWLQRSEEHQAAWQRIEQFQQQLQFAPTDAVHHAVESADEKNRQRRRFLKTLLSLALISPAAYFGYRHTAHWRAAYRTAVGEIKNLQLDDGTELTLNTDTALNVSLHAAQQQLHLLRGEVLITTAEQSHPLIVKTAHGAIRPLGTRFSVRLQSEHSQVAVLEQAVSIELDTINRVRLQAGQQVRFTAQQIQEIEAVDATQIAWARGMLIVDDWSLAEFLTELSRYRRGYLGYDAAAAELRISGSFPLQNTDLILDSLPNILPVRLRSMTRYWVSVEKI